MRFNIATCWILVEPCEDYFDYDEWNELMEKLIIIVYVDLNLLEHALCKAIFDDVNLSLSMKRRVYNAYYVPSVLLWGQRHVLYCKNTSLTIG